MYYTSCFYLDQIYGTGTYYAITVTNKIIGMIFGLVLAYIVEHTESRQGRFHPYFLIGSLLAAVSGFCMFWIPEIGHIGKLIWVCVFYILYYTFAMGLYGLSGNMITVSTRDQNDRTLIGVFNNIDAIMIAGIAIGLGVSSFLYYVFLIKEVTDPVTGVTTIVAMPERWIILVGIFAIISIPFSLLRYYYTKERLTIDNKAMRVESSQTDEKYSVTLARGEEWIEPEELDCLERLENEQLTEEARLRDLRVKCQRKGLDFDAEEAKYQAKLARKHSKK